LKKEGLMSSLNKVMLIGRLGRDPEVRHTPEGTPVASFSLATSEFWTDKNGTRQERTEWHNIVAWNKLAELSRRYLAKGRQVYIEGRIRTRDWDDKEGNKRRTTEIIASQILFVGARPDQAEVPAAQATPVQRGAQPFEETPQETPDITDDDIPF
jgi:single-strand DNA-binding protein